MIFIQESAFENVVYKMVSISLGLIVLVLGDFYWLELTAWWKNALSQVH